MKCEVCGAESGRYPLCRACNAKKEQGVVIKCQKCGCWHHKDKECSQPQPVSGGNIPFLYSKRRELITKSEQEYYKAILSSLPQGYYVFPQINLAAFIDRTDNARFRNELFRNVDFLVTDEEYRPMVAIEINDQTHMNSDRKERDEKVHNICEEAGIPLLTLWTSYGVRPEYIKTKIAEILDSLPIERKHHFQLVQEKKQPTKKNGGGCYVATCVYGSYDCPQVWTLRRYRDNCLATTVCGRMFIRVYYAVSPVAVKLFGNTKMFRRFWKQRLDKKVFRLNQCGYDDTPYTD